MVAQPFTLVKVTGIEGRKVQDGKYSLRMSGVNGCVVIWSRGSGSIYSVVDQHYHECYKSGLFRMAMNVEWDLSESRIEIVFSEKKNRPTGRSREKMKYRGS